jgi:Circularly permutated YpsA SLOG family
MKWWGKVLHWNLIKTLLLRETAVQATGNEEIDMRPANLKIISGGQTGADRAALDWAIAHNIPHGGWCPQGRIAEDGVIPDTYSLKESPSPDYPQRTMWNIRDSDATLILSISPVLTGGSKRTLDYATELGKPCLHLIPGMNPTIVIDFLQENKVQTLNVAGPRASKEPQVYDFVVWVLSETLRRNNCA